MGMSLLFLLSFSWFSGFLQPLAEPGKGEKDRMKYKFTQAWVWQYQNDWIADGEAGHRGEIVVYHDSLSNTWLFNKEAYGSSGDGFDFVVGNYDGQYTFCFRDEKGKKRKTVRNVSEIAASRNDDGIVKEEFGTYNKATGNTRLFGEKGRGRSVVEGHEYKMEHLKTDEVTFRYIADTGKDFQPIVYFNFIDGEVKLPVHFPTDIPLGKLLLEDNTVYPDGKRILIRLKEIAEADYRVDLGAYR